MSRTLCLCVLVTAVVKLLNAAEADTCASGTCPDPSLRAEELELEELEAEDDWGDEDAESEPPSLDELGLKDDETETLPALEELYKQLRREEWKAMFDGRVPCADSHERCSDWAQSGECSSNTGYMLRGCPKSCYVCCEDTHPECESWALGGQCDINPVYMHTGCPYSCGTCDALDTRTQCKRPPEMISGLTNLSIDQMFRRLDPDDESFVFPQFKPEVMSRDPWVVYLHEFVTHEHADGLVAAMLESGHSFAASQEMDAGSHREDKPTRRTSESMFCDNKECQEDPRVLAAHDLVVNITGLQLGSMEYIQVVRYKTDQFYVSHQDTSETYSRAANGNRIYTLFVYLSDVDEEMGGETSFPQIGANGGLKVPAKKGAATLWTNVKTDNPDKVDVRSTHAGLPVLGGPPKLAANFWMYAYDWRALSDKGCMNVAMRP